VKPYSQFVSEECIVGGFVIARSQMPQINDVNAFKAFLTSASIDYVEGDFDPRKFKPVQIDVDAAKIADIADFDKPIIVSADDYILDGHHRYFAGRDRSYIKAIKVDLTINKLLSLAYEFTRDG